jgi:hypothetical protein
MAQLERAAYRTQSAQTEPAKVAIQPQPRHMSSVSGPLGLTVKREAKSAPVCRVGFRPSSAPTMRSVTKQTR